MAADSKRPLDARLDDAAREGLTGTAPASLYGPPQQDETVSRPPDDRPEEAQPAWRRDFPIDCREDDYVTRREFGKFLVLTSLAFAVGQLWIVARSLWRRSQGSLPALRIASLRDVAVGQTLVFQYPGERDNCVLVRTGPSELVAYGQKCTHLSCAVVPRPDEGVIRCPCHEGLFDLRSGRPLAGPPPRPLPLVHLELRGDAIYATGVEQRGG